MLRKLVVCSLVVGCVLFANKSFAVILECHLPEYHNTDGSGWLEYNFQLDTASPGCTSLDTEYACKSGDDDIITLSSLSKKTTRTGSCQRVDSAKPKF